MNIYLVFRFDFQKFLHFEKAFEYESSAETWISEQSNHSEYIIDEVWLEDGVER